MFRFIPNIPDTTAPTPMMRPPISMNRLSLMISFLTLSRWAEMNWSVSSIMSMKILISVSISSRSAATELRRSSMSSLSFSFVKLKLIISSSSVKRFLRT